jgi:hypoxanthine phosphoribosyltransferase
VSDQSKFQKSYDYQDRKGVRPVSWEDFHGLCKGLAAAIHDFDAEIILAIGRGGYYPGTLIAHMLQVELYPVRISRRVADVVRYKQPCWILQPQMSMVKDRRVAIVDEICDSGETLTLVKEKVEGMGAKEVRSAVLYSHTWKSSVPDYIGIITDALILNPWDREIIVEGDFQFHPEYAGALQEQGIKPDASLLIQSSQMSLAKG